MGDTGSHSRGHKERPSEGPGTMWLLPGTLGAAQLSWEGTGLREQVWLSRVQAELSEVTLGLAEALPQMQISVMLDLIYFFVLWLLKGKGARSWEERDTHHFPSTVCLHVCSWGAFPQEDKRSINSHIKLKSILLCAEITSSRDFTN